MSGNKWWTLVAVCLGTFMLLLDVTIVTVALPDIQQALNSRRLSVLVFRDVRSLGMFFGHLICDPRA